MLSCTMAFEVQSRALRVLGERKKARNHLVAGPPHRELGKCAYALPSPGESKSWYPFPVECGKDSGLWLVQIDEQDSVHAPAKARAHAPMLPFAGIWVADVLAAITAYPRFV